MTGGGGAGYQERAMSTSRSPHPFSARPGAVSDFLSIVEAACAVESPVADWTMGLLYAADRSIGTGRSGFACHFRAKDDGTIAIDRSSTAIVGQAPEAVSAIFDGLTRAPPGWLSSYMKSARSALFCGMTSEIDPRFDLRYRSDLARDGVHDGINIACMDLDRNGVLISLGVGEGTKLSPETRQMLVRVATHIVSAQRMRRRIAAGQAAAPGQREPAHAGEAVFSPDGKLLHAEGDARMASARRALQTAVRDVESARTALRGDPRRALSLWKVLVSARWTLVDHFDAQGTRYVVARDNAPRASALSRLTPTESCVVSYAAEGYSTKEIAYTLGIKDGTVRVLIMRAAHRCGVSNRRELFVLVSAQRPDAGARS